MLLLKKIIKRPSKIADFRRMLPNNQAKDITKAIRSLTNPRIILKRTARKTTSQRGRIHKFHAVLMTDDLSWKKIYSRL